MSNTSTEPKRHFLLIAGRPVEARNYRESPLEAAKRRYGRPFGKEGWPTGEGPRFWTAERIATLALANERLREARKRK